MSSKKKIIKGRHATPSELRSKILTLFKKNPSKKFNPKQLFSNLKVSNPVSEVQQVLESLAQQHRILKEDGFLFSLHPGMNKKRKQDFYSTGKVDMTKMGSAYIVGDEPTDDVYIPAGKLNTAMNGDFVKIRYWYPAGRRKPEGEVVEVVKRAADSFIGKLKIYKSYGWVTTSSIHSIAIGVPPDQLKGAEDDEIVVVKIVKWGGTIDGRPEGTITSRLGKEQTHEIEMKAILLNNGFPLDFSPQAIAESEALNEKIDEKEIAQRRDFRGVTTFTIDPETARDFDDALSYRLLEDDKIEVGVHIADVSYYVRPGTILDQEAFERSTSVYLVDRVNPMLPEKLSNELCSLRPHEDKLTYSAVFVFDKNYHITDRWFGRTVIHSDRRFSYEEAQNRLDSGEGEFAEELKILNQIALKLREKRFAEGSIGFETEEVQFELDEMGNPIGIFVKERKDAHLLIEDFMLLANKEVAIYMSKKGVPFVYRIHDQPDIDKVLELAVFASNLGFTINTQNPKTISKSFNQLVIAGREDHSLKMLEPLAIRTMAKAAYSTKNIGHYGLGFTNYTHFTSPIRRYSDVLAHRLLDANLGKETYFAPSVPLEEKCKHISLQERKAMDAERESVKYKQVQFMESHIGGTFEGYITGITDRGFFVELTQTRCEGMVSFSKTSEPFELSNGNLKMTGRISGKELKMGDPVTVKVISTDLTKRQIEFFLLPEE